MTSGFETTSKVLTICHTPSVPSAAPFCTTHGSRTFLGQTGLELCSPSTSRGGGIARAAMGQVAMSALGSSRACSPRPSPPTVHCSSQYPPIVRTANVLCARSLPSPCSSRPLRSDLGIARGGGGCYLHRGALCISGMCMWQCRPSPRAGLLHRLPGHGASQLRRTTGPRCAQDGRPRGPCPSCAGEALRGWGRAAREAPLHILERRPCAAESGACRAMPCPSGGTLHRNCMLQRHPLVLQRSKGCRGDTETLLRMGACIPSAWTTKPPAGW